jgi:hypothetical protein
VVEKVAAMAIENFCEAKELLYEAQFGCRKRRSAIDVVVKLIYIIEKA